MLQLLVIGTELVLCAYVSGLLYVSQSIMISYSAKTAALKRMTFVKWLILAFLTVSHRLFIVRCCEVQVSPPWEPITFVPHEISYMSVSCSDVAIYEGKENQLEWAIGLPDRESDDKFNSRIRSEILNMRGFYELSTVTLGPKIFIQMAINNTEGINGTEIKCERIWNGEIIHRTTIYVYEPTSLFAINASDVDERSINISWSSSEPKDDDVKQNFLLMAEPTTNNIPSRLFETQKRFYKYYAPEDAPPCVVYNFSVSATYAGATYTGAGCSVRSPVLSRMLPSLPDITGLESSLNYTLQKRSGKPAKYCEEYPVDNYSLVVEGVGPAGSPQVELFTTENQLIADYLSEDAVYIFKVHAQNSVGKVSTKGIEIYTTDIQSVEILELVYLDSVRINCRFMTGSDARGCMVILMGELSNATMSLTRKDDSVVAVAIHTLPHSLTCYHQVVAFDIESNGKVGTVTVPGILHRQVNQREKCNLPTKETPLQVTSTTMSSLIAGILVPVVLLLAAISVVGVIIILLRVKVNRFTRAPIHRTLTSLEEKTADNGYNNPIALYAVPMKLKKTLDIRTTGDGAENDNAEQVLELTITTKEGTDIINPKWTQQPDCLQGTEMSVSCDKDISPDPDAPELPPPFKPDSECFHVVYDEIPIACPPSESHKVCMLSPVYEDVLELSLSNRESPVKLELQTHKTNSPSSTKPFPVYEDIADLRNSRKALTASDNRKHRPINSKSRSIPVSETDSTSEHSKPALPPKCPKGHHMDTLAKSNDETENLALLSGSESNCVAISDCLTLGSNSSCTIPKSMQLSMTHLEPSLNTPENLQADLDLPPPYEQMFPHQSNDETAISAGGLPDINTTYATRGNTGLSNYII